MTLGGSSSATASEATTLASALWQLPTTASSNVSEGAIDGVRVGWSNDSRSSTEGAGLIESSLLEEESTSLVPLFVLLAAFALIVAGCVAVCHRFRSSHKKDRFDGEQCTPELLAQRDSYGAKYESKGRLRRLTCEDSTAAGCFDCSPPTAPSSPEGGGSPEAGSSPLAGCSPIVGARRCSSRAGLSRGERSARPGVSVSFADETSVPLVPHGREAVRANRSPAAGRKQHHQQLSQQMEATLMSTAAVGEHLIVVKQIQSPASCCHHAVGSLHSGGCNVVSDGLASETAAQAAGSDRLSGYQETKLTPGQPELHVALSENEELTIHSSDGRVFQVALIRASASGTSLSTEYAGGRRDPAGVHQQRHHRSNATTSARRSLAASGAPEHHRRRTVSEGLAPAKALNKQSGVGAGGSGSGGSESVAVDLAQDTPLGHRDSAACVATADKHPVRTTSLELPSADSSSAASAERESCCQHGVWQLVPAVPRAMARSSSPPVPSSSSESSPDDDHECAALLSKDIGCRASSTGSGLVDVEQGSALVGPFAHAAPVQNGDRVVSEHGR